MKCIIDNQVVLSRAPEGPLASYIGSFARSLSEQGYALDSIQRQIGAWKKLFRPPRRLVWLFAGREPRGLCQSRGRRNYDHHNGAFQKKLYDFHFWFCLRFARFTLRVRARESLTGIHLLLSSQHSSRASPKRTCLPECPENYSLLLI